MLLDWKLETEAQSANSALLLPTKCKDCTLEEIVVLRIIQQYPSATQTYIAKEIRKSERIVKTITARLTEKGIMKRSKASEITG
jgi:DNA-binding MarR family transcriptional regulator